MRTPFQRDRDRIVHATAFRRLTYKTQVFVFHEGDHYRTRLTHSLEVAQIARAIARMLGSTRTWPRRWRWRTTSAIRPSATPASGRWRRPWRAYGGFDHNAQSFKVVTRLERKYAGFDGLNLTFETLEGLAKHNGPLTGRAPAARPCCAGPSPTPASPTGCISSAFAPAEAQVGGHRRRHRLQQPRPRRRPAGRAASASTTWPTCRWPGGFVRRACRAPGVETQRVIYEVNRRMITAMIDDVVRESRARLAALAEPEPRGRARGAAAGDRAFGRARAPRSRASRTTCSPTSTAIRA